MENLKNIIFDLGGVLVDLDINRCIAAFRRLGMPEIAQIISPYYPAGIIGKLEKGDVTFHEACDQMRSLSRRPDVTDAQIASAYGEFLVDLPVAKLRLIESLRQRGYHTYVLSNNNSAAMEVIRRGFTADGHTMEFYFDKIYLSYQMHCLKPSPEIFHQMIADSGMLPEQSLFIDDAEHNVNAARALGFGVYMPTPNEDFSHLFDAI
ncbi:MAG: HAD family phosphatase [Alistipes sp.]